MAPDAQISVASLSGRDGINAFIKFPWGIYRNDPLWVPPLVATQRKFLDPRTGPFFEFGEAQYFLARRDGRPVGRVSAHINRRYEELHDQRTGFFGFFECVDDPAVAAALFEAASAWVKARGKSRLLGPMSFSIYDEIGILVEGFDSLPPILLNHNPPYYQDLLTGWGFVKAIDWLALRITNRNIDAAAMRAETEAIITRTGLALRAPQPAEVVRRAPEIYELFNETWRDNWGHIPFTPRQFQTVIGELRPILRSDLIRLVEDGFRIVGFTITIPDLNPTFQKFNGRMPWWGPLRLLWDARVGRLRKVKTVLMGVRRNYQGQRLHHAMILDTYAQLIRTQPRLEVGDCSLISEQLGFFIRSLRRYGARPYKTYRIFEKDLATDDLD